MRKSTQRSSGSIQSYFKYLGSISLRHVFHKSKGFGCSQRCLAANSNSRESLMHRRRLGSTTISPASKSLLTLPRLGQDSALCSTSVTCHLVNIRSLLTDSRPDFRHSISKSAYRRAPQRTQLVLVRLSNWNLYTQVFRTSSGARPSGHDLLVGSRSCHRRSSYRIDLLSSQLPRLRYWSW